MLFGDNGFLSKFSPKASFFAGIGAVLAIFFVVGFFVLLGIALKDKKKNSPAPALPPTAPAAVAPADIKVRPVDDSDWVRGQPNAKVTVVEFSDLECPFCKQFHPTMQRLLKEYPQDVRWAYRHFPLTSLHSKAPKEAEAAECAGELGGNDGFWKYVDKLFAVTPSNNGLDLNELPKIARTVGLDEKKFTACLDSGKYAQKVQEQADEAAAAGAQGTPYSVIMVGDQKTPVPGALPYEQIKSFIDSQVK